MRNSWQHAVQAAVDESDPNRLQLKIQQAEVAIFQRIEAFSSTHDGEEEALFEALRKIRELANQLTPIQSRRLRSGGAFQNRRNQLVGEVRLVQHLDRSDAIR